MTKRSARATTVKRSRRAATVKRSATARQPTAVKRSRRAAKANGRGHASERRPTYKPSRKTTAATLGSAAAALVLYVANTLAHKNGAPAVSGEMAGLVTVAATFAASWLIPPGAREAIIETARGGHRTAVA
jgi:hypothetical protein